MLPNKRQLLYKPFMLGLTILLVTFTLAACGGKNKTQGEAADNSKVIAEYQGGNITENEFNAFLGGHKFFNYNEMYMYYEMSPDFKSSMLNQYIAMLTLTQDVPEEQREAANAQATKDIQGIKDEMAKNPEQKKMIDDFLNTEKIDMDDLDNYFSIFYTLRTVLDDKFTEEQIKQHYNEQIAKNANAYVTTATVRHVLVAFKDQEGKEIRTKEEALERANEAYEKLVSTGDWDKLALEYSDDGNKNVGGIYENADVTQWVEEFKNAALTQPLNVIGKPLETQFGYHVMVVESRGSNEYEAVKNNVKSELINQYFGDYITNEVPKLIIGEVHLPEPEAPEAESGAGTENEAPDNTSKSE
jgi:foldase protein PrsA